MESWKSNRCSSYFTDIVDHNIRIRSHSVSSIYSISEPCNCFLYNILNQNALKNVRCSSMLHTCQKTYSLPNHYKPAQTISTRRKRVREKNDDTGVDLSRSLSVQLYRQRFSLMQEWFNEFTDAQRSRVLVDLLDHIGQSQMHLLSILIGPRLHEGCPPNCQDPFSWIPVDLSLIILSYLDPVSLSRASQVCRNWNKLISKDSLWKQLSLQERWSLSNEGHEQQLQKCLRTNGTIDWKQIFIERFRLKRNWLGAHCHIRTFEGHEEGVSCVQFDNNRIVSGSHDNTIKVWNRRTNSQWSVQTLVGHFGMVRCLHLSDNRIVSGSADKTIKVWEVEETSEWSSITCKVTMVGHTDTVRCLQVKDDLVVSGSYDTSVRIWSLNTGECQMHLLGHSGPVLTVAFDHDKVVSGAADMTIKIWKMTTGHCVNNLIGHKDAVTTLTFDTTRIISGSLDCTIRIWCVQTGNCVGVLDWMSSEGHTGVIRCLAADSWRIVSASDDKTIKVWDRQTGKRMVTLRNHTDGITCLAFDDYIIVSGSYDKTVKLWDFSVC